MRYVIKASKLGANETRQASTLVDAFNAFVELAGQGFIVNVIDAETGAQIEDESLLSVVET